MKKKLEKHWGRRAVTGILSCMLALVIGFTMNVMVSHAQSQGKISASSANIRKNADPNSEVIGSGEKDASVTINGRTTGTDGYTWYQIFVNSETLGFVRSDLVEITDGTTPKTVASTTTSTAEAPSEGTQTVTTADVTELNPISATVTGGQAVRVRSNASTNGDNIITTVQSGLAVTVTGKTAGSDGRTWWLVNFNVDGSEVMGFIREDYLSLSGEPTQPEAESPEEGNEIGEGEQPQAPEVSVQVKEWETAQQGDVWILIDNRGETALQYKIEEDLIGGVEHNGELYLEAKKTADDLKILVIVLILVIVVIAAAAVLMFFKLRDTNDEAYFAEAEREAEYRRNADRSRQGSSQRDMKGHVGSAGQSGRTSQGGRPGQGVSAGQSGRSVQSGRPSQGVSAGQSGRTVQGGRSVQSGSESQSRRPAQGGRSVQSGSESQSRRTVQGGRSVQSGSESQSGRPVQGAGKSQGGSAVQSERISQAGRPVQGERPVAERPADEQSRGKQKDTRQEGRDGNSQNSGWKSKNFMTDDDEFEFEFLNWDGEEEV